MAFDFKKEYKSLYLPKARPEIVQVPQMHYIAVRGQGDPNEPGGAYQQGHRRPVRRGVHTENEL